jgi:hypothetical protein
MRQTPIPLSTGQVPAEEIHITRRADMLYENDEYYSEL